MGTRGVTVYGIAAWTPSVQDIAYTSTTDLMDFTMYGTKVTIYVNYTVNCISSGQ